MCPQYKASLEAIGGYDIETGGRPLDPLKLAKWIPAETLRKYETVHCRVAMLACVGYAFPRESQEIAIEPRVLPDDHAYFNPMQLRDDALVCNKTSSSAEETVCVCRG